MEVRQSHQRPVFPFSRAPEQDGKGPGHYPVVVVGAGLVGLGAAVDLAQGGLMPVVLERQDTVSDGSRSICQAKRTLEIWDRLGVGERARDKGINWKVGKIFHRERQLYQFDLLPEPGHKMPAFVNLQQYYCEEYLVERFAEQGGQVRWRHGVSSIEPHADHVRVHVETPEGRYTLTCDWLLVCDGAGSPIRRAMGLDPEGRVFEDKFLICDVKMTAPFPTERWFWFEPPFHEGQTALLHRQADDVWRIDFQLGWDADVEAEKAPERVVPRLKAMLGEKAEFTLEWISVYVFQCRTLDRYVHGRVLFAGDAAHQVSPFGARGGNGGVQDTDNLVWKLLRVVDGRSPVSLLESYTEERRAGADENILNSTRATDFMTPKTAASRMLRDEVLALAEEAPFARALLNSGRLSVPAHYGSSSLNTPDRDDFATRLKPGSPASDAPVRVEGKPGWFLDALHDGFTVVTADAGADAGGLSDAGIRLLRLGVDGDLEDGPDGHLVARYDLTPGTTYLFRPDQHVAARWRRFDAGAILAAHARATGNAGGEA